MAGNYDVFDTKNEQELDCFIASCPWNNLNCVSLSMTHSWGLSIRQVNLKITGLSAILVK